MNIGDSALLLIFMALVAANLPWITERVLLVIPPPKKGKREWLRLLEWSMLFLIVGGMGRGLEYRLTGQFQAQDWEFYITGLCVFLVFALPGFIYRHDLLRHLRKRR